MKSIKFFLTGNWTKLVLVLLWTAFNLSTIATEVLHWRKMKHAFLCREKSPFLYSRRRYFDEYPPPPESVQIEWAGYIACVAFFWQKSRNGFFVEVLWINTGEHKYTSSLPSNLWTNCEPRRGPVNKLKLKHWRTPPKDIGQLLNFWYDADHKKRAFFWQFWVLGIWTHDFRWLSNFLMSVFQLWKVVAYRVFLHQICMGLKRPCRQHDFFKLILFVRCLNCLHWHNHTGNFGSKT